MADNLAIRDVSQPYQAHVPGIPGISGLPGIPDNPDIPGIAAFHPLFHTQGEKNVLSLRMHTTIKMRRKNCYSLAIPI